MRWLLDVRLVAGLAISGLIGFATLTGLGWSFSHSLEQREADLSRLSPEARAAVEIRAADRLSRDLLGVELGPELDEMMAEQERMLDQLAVDGQLDEASSRALEELQQEVRRTRGALRRDPKDPVKKGEVERVPFGDDEPPLFPAWAAAALFGFGILVVGAGASFLLLRTTDPPDDAS